jgi:hypothetical protein
MRCDERVKLAGVSLGVEDVWRHGDMHRTFTAVCLECGHRGIATVNCADGRLKALLTFLRMEVIDEALIH